MIWPPVPYVVWHWRTPDHERLVIVPVREGGYSVESWLPGGRVVMQDGFSTTEAAAAFLCHHLRGDAPPDVLRRLLDLAAPREARRVSATPAGAARLPRRSLLGALQLQIL